MHARLNLRVGLPFMAMIVSLIVAGLSYADDNEPALVVAQNTTSDVSKNAVYGPVKKKESLWSIAARYRPAYTTMSQVVFAIYQRNPEAFRNKDINRLKVGAMLAIPSTAQMQQVDHRSAYAAINPRAVKAKIKKPKNNSLSQSKPQSSKPSKADQVNQVEPNKEMITESRQSDIEVPAVVEPLPQITKPTQKQVVDEKPAKVKRPKKRPLFRYSYNVSIADDDNIRRAQNEVDIRGDTVTSVTINARGGQSLDGFSLIAYGGSVTYESFDVFDELNNFSFNANAKYRFSNSAAFTAPVYTIGAKLGGIESESEMRDSTLLSASFDVNKWLTTTINMTTGLNVRTRESKSEVFDTSEARAFVNFDLNVSKSILFYGTYTYISGDIVSSATPSLKIINASEVIEPDDAFGGIANNQFAYRLDAESQVFTLGYNHMLGGSTSLDVSFRYIDSEATDDIYYDRNILRASLLGRF